MIDWKPIVELPDALKDGRPVLLWVSWASARALYPAELVVADEPVCARWKHAGIGYWALTDAANATDDEISGDVTHFAEIDAPGSLLGIGLANAPEFFGMGLAQCDDLPDGVAEIRDRRTGAVLARIESIAPKPD